MKGEKRTTRGLPKVYPFSHGSCNWMVSWRHEGKRERYYFKKKEAAEKKRDELKKQIIQEGAEGVHFGADARAEWHLARKILDPFGVSLLEAAQDYAKRHSDRSHAKAWKDAVFDFKEHLERANRRPRTIHNHEQNLALFGRYVEAETLAELTTDNVEAFLRSNRAWKPATVTSYRASLSAFGSFCKRKRWLPVNPVADTAPPILDRGDPVVYSIDETNRILTVAANLRSQYRPTTEKKLYYDYGRIVRRLALLHLAGLRPTEIDQLKPSDVRPDGIRIGAGKKRGRRSVRIVPISPTFRAWWDHYPTKFDDFNPPNFRNLYRRAKQAAGVTKRGTKIERHSWISARLATVHNEDRVSREAGNSPDVVFNDYFQLIAESEAAQLGAYCPLDSHRDPRPD